MACIVPRDLTVEVKHLADKKHPFINIFSFPVVYFIHFATGIPLYRSIARNLSDA
jgi:hypothetical protein